MAGKQGEANITLSATDQTKAAIESAKRNLAQLGDVASSLPSKFGSIGTAIATAFAGGSLIHAIDMLDALDDMAEKTGVSVEKLSELRYAGEAVGTTNEMLRAGMSKLAKVMADAASGNKDAAALFTTLGVAATDANGKLRATDQVLTDLAQRFASFEDGAAKQGWAKELFGKSGEDMIPLLNQGAAGIASLAGEAKALGAVYGGELAKAAADFNDNLKKIKLASEGAAISISGPLIKALGEVSQAFIDAKKSGEGYFGMLARGASLAPQVPDAITNMIPMLKFFKIFQMSGQQLKTPKSTETIQDYVNKLGGANGGAGRGSVNPRVSAPALPQSAPAVPKDNSAANYIASLNTQMAALYGQASKVDDVTAHLATNTDKFTVAQKAEALTIADAIDRMNKMAQAAEQVARAKTAEIDATERATEGYHNAIDAMEQAADAQRIEAENIGKLAPAIEKARFEREQAKRVREAESALVTRGILEGWDEIRMEEERARVLKIAAEETANFSKVQADQFDKTYNASRGVSEAMKDYAEMANQHGKNAADAVGRIMGSIEDGMTDLLTKGQFNVKALVDMMIAEFMRLQIVRPMMTSIFGSGGFAASMMSSIFGAPAKMAGGGTLTPGMPTLVGENGPELIYPTSAGRVVPNSQIGGGGVVVNVIEAPGQGGTQQRSTDSSGNDVITVFVDRVKSAIAGDIMRGNGAVPSALASTYGLNRAAGAY